MAVASQSAQQFVILDRDGVINEDSDDYIKCADEWQPIAGSLAAIARLSQAGYRIIVVTNQSGLGRKLFDEYALAQIHHKLCSMVEEEGGTIDGLFYCPHTPAQNCACRKPATGLLQQAEEEFACSLAHSYFIGDTTKDIDAALAHGCRPVLVRTGKGRATEQELLSRGMDDVPVFDDLAQATAQLFFNATS